MYRASAPPARRVSGTAAGRRTCGRVQRCGRKAQKRARPAAAASTAASAAASPATISALAATSATASPPAGAAGAGAAPAPPPPAPPPPRRGGPRRRRRRVRAGRTSARRARSAHAFCGGHVCSPHRAARAPPQRGARAPPVHDADLARARRLAAVRPGGRSCGRGAGSACRGDAEAQAVQAQPGVERGWPQSGRRAFALGAAPHRRALQRQFTHAQHHARAPDALALVTAGTRRTAPAAGPPRCGHGGVAAQVVVPYPNPAVRRVERERQQHIAQVHRKVGGERGSGARGEALGQGAAGRPPRCRAEQLARPTARRAPQSHLHGGQRGDTPRRLAGGPLCTRQLWGNRLPPQRAS